MQAADKLFAQEKNHADALLILVHASPLYILYILLYTASLLS
jgi:hypothetical protein